MVSDVSNNCSVINFGVTLSQKTVNSACIVSKDCRTLIISVKESKLDGEDEATINNPLKLCRQYLPYANLTSQKT